MRIFFIQPRVSYYQGGGEKYALDAIRELSKTFSDSTYTLITTRQSEDFQSKQYKSWKTEYLGKRNVSVIELDVPEKFQYIYSITPGEDRFRWDVESLYFANLSRTYIDNLPHNESPEVIWVFYLVDYPFISENTKTVLNLLGYPRVESEYREAFLSQYDAIVPINSNIVRHWNAQLKQSVEPYAFLPLGMDFKLTSTPKSSHESTQITYLGRLIKRKGVMELCHAVKQLIDEGQGIKLTILGEGPLYNELLTFIESHSLHASIKLEGHVENTSEYLATSDICVLPSGKGEGQMSSVLEALYYCGVVATTEQNGNEDYITHKVNGYLMSSNTPTDIIGTYKWYRELSSEEIAKIKDTARQCVEKNTWEAYCKSFMNICSHMHTRD